MFFLLPLTAPAATAAALTCPGEASLTSLVLPKAPIYL